MTQGFVHFLDWLGCAVGAQSSICLSPESSLHKKSLPRSTDSFGDHAGVQASHIRTQQPRLPSSSSGGSFTKPVAFLLIFDSLLGLGFTSTFVASTGLSGEASGASGASGASQGGFWDLSEMALMMISIGGSSTASKLTSGLPPHCKRALRW